MNETPREGRPTPALYRLNTERGWGHDPEYDEVSPTELAANLVGVTDIASRYGVKPNTVSQWRIRHADFPTPLGSVSGLPVWWAPDVNEWQKGRQR